MHKNIFILVLVLLSKTMFAQITMSGYIKDAKTGEKLVYANVENVETKQYAVSDDQGHFSIQSDFGNTIRITYVGYSPVEFQVEATKDTMINVLLKSDLILETVYVVGQRNVDANVVKLNAKEIKQIPTLGSVPDVFKSIQFLPGVQSQSEASSMLIVRGGGPGENLYLLDNTPLIYVNHLGGFLSVFNPDMINDLTLYKGGFPSRYGGKLSSIVSVTQRSGDNLKFRSSFGVGLTDVNVSMEGPVFDKGSYIVTARKTLYDLFLIAASSFSNGNDGVISNGFHDINGKFSFNFNERNNFYFNLYQGDDYFLAFNKTGQEFSNTDNKSKYKNVWGNWMLSGSWNYMPSVKLFGQTGVSYTYYRKKEQQSSRDLIEDKNLFSSRFRSSVQDFEIRSHWKYDLMSEYKLLFGLQYSHLNHMPYELDLSGNYNSYEKSFVLSDIAVAYLDNKIKLAKWWELTAGVRFSIFSTEDYCEKFLEPRINAKFDLGQGSVSVTYMQTNQTSHLLFASANNIMTSEIWIPATREISPSRAQQFTVGCSRSFLDGMLTLQTDLYYKEMEDLATYIDGYIDVKNTPNWTSLIVTDGYGTSYGIEVLVKKNIGKWKGSLCYTYSKTMRLFETLNKGKEYRYEYDRPHTFSCFGNRIVNDRWSVGLAWVYQSGLPYTPAIGRQYNIVPDEYDLNGNPIYVEAFIFGERNSKRMKAYHRLDISANYNVKTKKGRDATWTFSVYNVYARQNANMYYYNRNTTDELYTNQTDRPYHVLELYQVSLFSILPSVSYKLHF